MLNLGIILSSKNPFASLILLVKKDGPWRLCLDYRKLNFVISMIKFLIPFIEELLGELTGVVIFS